MTIIKRAAAPTPKFFKLLRTVGLVLLAVSGSVFAAPVVLPAALVIVAGYVAVAGVVMSAVSQITVDDSALKASDSKSSKSLPKRGNPFGHDPDIYGD